MRDHLALDAAAGAVSPAPWDGARLPAMSIAAPFMPAWPTLPKLKNGTGGHMERGNGLLIYREILATEAMHARRAHRVSSTCDARLRAVTHAVLRAGQ